MLEILKRAAAFEPSTFDAETNSVQCIFSTGSDVQRNDFEGPYIERLDMSSVAVDLSQLRGGPLLDNHNRHASVNAVLGVVEDASTDGKRGIAKIRLGARPEIQGIVTDIRSGVIRNVSAGYRVQEWKTTKGTDGTRIKTAVRWMPVELSLAPLGADPDAKIRSMGEQMEHAQQIRNIAEAVGVAATFADGLIQRNATLEEARAELIREAARTTPVINNRTAAPGGGELSPAEMTRAVGEALYARINPAHKLSDAARPYAGRRLADIHRDVLRQRGHSALGSDVEIFGRASHTISDFTSGIFSEFFNKGLLTLRESPAPIQQVFKRAIADDFRDKHLFEISDGSGLLRVNETGEIRSGTITDKKLSSYHIDSYARKFALSFQAQVNDDMGALADLSAKMTRGARTWFTSLLVKALIANPKLADNLAVFHATHANLAAGGDVGAPGESTIAAGKLAMRLQKDASGNPIDAAPKFILIPAALETTVDKLLATLYPQQPSEAIVSARSLTPIVDPRLDAEGQTAAWYLFADPAITPVFEYSELSGYEGPQVEVKQGFDTLGLEIRVVWHVGAGAIDSRGAWKNPGA